MKERDIDKLLLEYGKSHKNAINKLIHWFCVPTIFFSIVGFIYAIPLPMDLPKSWWFNWATLVMIIIYLYYLKLSFPLFLGFLFWGFLCLWGNYQIYFTFENSNLSLVLFSTILFIIAWVFQFIGHKIEGAKPSFLSDIKFLLIGPAWLLHFIYIKIGIKY